MKRIYIVCLLMTVLLLAGCQKESKERKQSEDWSYHYVNSFEVRAYKNGFYYIKDHYWLSYYDSKSGKCAVLCEKNGCRHNSDKCFAYTEDGLPHIWNDKLCTVTGEGSIVVTDTKNREKETLDTIGKKQMKEEKCALFVWDYMVSGDMLYVRTHITDYSSDAKYQEAETIFAYDMSTKKEKEIVTVDSEKETLHMLMAKGEILYYTVENNGLDEDVTTMTEEERKECFIRHEKRIYSKLYRADCSEETVTFVKEVNHGFIIGANDEIGVYYYEFAGDGSYSGSKLYHWKPEEEKEEVVLDQEGTSSFQVSVPISPKHLIITSEKKSAIYNMDGFVQEEFLHPALQEGMVYPVPGGYAFERKVGEDKNGGDISDWYYLSEEEAQKPDGNAILAE